MTLLDERIAEYEQVYGQAHPGRRMNAEEFLEWIQEKTRAEWVDGEVEMMAPASLEHDDLVGWVRMVVKLFVDHHDLGRVLGPEVLVNLASIRQKRLPDVMFVQVTAADSRQERGRGSAGPDRGSRLA
jgi:Uma2 family endonuclease